MNQQAFNIYNQDGKQVDSVPEGCKWPVLRYVSPSDQPILVQTFTLQEVAQFPVLGFRRIEIELKASFSPQAIATNRTCQVRYQLVSYKDGGGPVGLDTGIISPSYDNAPLCYNVNARKIGLRLSIPPSTSAGVLRTAYVSFAVEGVP
jgi:hypothetical protein